MANEFGQDRLISLAGAAHRELPRRWLSAIAKAANEAAQAVKPYNKHEAKGDVWAYWLTHYAGADSADLSEGDIRARAANIAARAKYVPQTKTAIMGFVERFGGKLLVEKRDSIFVSYWLKRISCERWWRGQLRRWVVQKYERGEIELGMVGAAAGAWYCSDKAVRRRIHQVQASEAMMRATVLENALGERVTLWDAAQSTVANKSHRRDELMTRIRGCEEWADEHDLVGMFTTNTCPSRFHAARRGGGKNKKYDGSTPDMAQAWLNEAWSRCRAMLHRQGVHVMGFRVAEPHHDGCPHWHMLLWCKPCHYEQVEAAMREHWLREPEHGSDKNRLKIKRMDKGGAAGYVAKYIAKNIDDHQITHHHDDDFADYGADSVIEREASPARRVEAWASAWRIRQFQAIGQPSVTVWRELRRVTIEAAAGGSDTLIKAWLAVHRRGERMACWRGYMEAQGGAMCKRQAYKLASFAIDKRTVGRYGEAVQAWTCGIRERALEEGFVTPTKRQQWGAEGFAQGREAPAWTRWNNCTRARAANRKNLTPTLDEWRENKAPETNNWQIDRAKAQMMDEFWAAQHSTM